MTRLVPVLVLALGLLGCARSHAREGARAGTDVGQTLPTFTAKAIDLATGKTRELRSNRLERPTVFLVVGTTCPTTQRYVERMRELEATYVPKGVDFVYVYPNKGDTREAKEAFHRQHQLGGRLIDDKGAAIAVGFLAAKKTSEIIVTAKDGTIVYRGAIDDNKDAGRVTRRHLAVALDEHLAGKPVTIAKTDVFA